MKKLACPFCGERSLEFTGDCCWSWMRCAKCKACGPAVKNRVLAIKLWNTRKKPKKEKSYKSVLANISAGLAENLED